MHSRSVTRDRQVRVEQGLKRLADSFADYQLIRNSKTLIDAFDLVKLSAEEVAEAERRVGLIRAKLLKKTAYRHFWKFI